MGHGDCLPRQRRSTARMASSHSGPCSVSRRRPQPASSHRRGLEQVPLFDLPNRRYHLMHGARHAATTISEPGADRLQIPDLWWPDDRRSFVATGTDLDWTYIAGSQAFIAETSRPSPIEARS